MSGSAAFSGMKLSENTPSNGLDQRLFGEAAKGMAREPAAAVRKPDDKPAGAPERPAAPRPPEPPLRRKSSEPQRQSAPRITVNGQTVAEPQPPGAGRWAELAFDINVKPYRKDSFLFTDDEFEAMEDLKLELKRTYDLPATKNDIARIALQRLFEDYARRSASSAVVARLQQKKT